MKIVKKAKYQAKERPLKPGEEEAYRSPAIIEVGNTRFFSITPVSELHANEINASLEEIKEEIEQEYGPDRTDTETIA